MFLSFSAIVNAISQAVSFRLMRTLSQQIEASRHGQSVEPQGFLGSFLQRLTGIPARQTMSDRIESTRFEKRSAKKLEKSSRRLSSFQQAQDEATQKYDQAVANVQSAVANPQQGQNLQALIDEADKYALELKHAQEALKKATESHDNLAKDIESERATLPKPGRQKSFAERFFGGPSDENRQRVKESQDTHQTALRDQTAAKTALEAARKAHDDEAANPTGKDLSKLKDNIDALSKAFDDATKQVHDTARAHLSLEKEVARQTKWQKERSAILSPSRFIEKSRQRIRIAGKQFQRFQQAFSTALGARRRLATANKNVVQAIRAGKGITRARGARATAKVAAKNATRAALILGARSALAAGGVALRIAGPIGIALATVSAAVSALKGVIDRQRESGEQRVREIAATRAPYSGSLSAAISQYEAQDWRLNRRTAQQTSASAEGVIRSTMDLKEAQQPQNAAWEDIGNKIQSAAIDTATMLQQIINAVDFVTPLMQTAVEYLQWLPWIKTNTDKKGGGNIGIQALQTFQNINNANRPQRAFPPLPKLK